LHKRALVAIAHSKQNGRYQVALELFAGKGLWSKTAHSFGYGCISLDIAFGPECDLLNPRVQAVVKGWLSSGLICVVWLGTPCSSWSRARHDFNGGGPRNQEFIFGLKDLSVADQHRVDVGNKSLRFSLQIIRVCIRMRIICCLENPLTSWMWSAPPLQLLSLKGHLSITDYCQFGTPWRKSTKVLVFNINTEQLPQNRCVGKHHLCSTTGKPHVILSGIHPTRNIPWTKVAEPYPKKWCVSWWKCIDDAIQNVKSAKIMALLYENR